MAKIEVKCIGFNDYAQGMFKVNNKICFCNNFLPGEIGLVEKNKYDKYYISSFSKTSKDRVESECDYYSKCGGCHLLHMNKQLQKKFKIDYVQTAFTDKKLNSKIDEYIEPDSYKGYRNKMQVAYKFQEGKLVYGFYEEESHKIIPMKKCIVQTESQNEIAKVIKDIMLEMKLKPYDEDRRMGLVRFVMIREAFSSGEILVTIVTNSEVFPGKNEFVKRLIKRCPYITSIVQNINTRKTSIILGDDERVLYGPGYIKDYLCGIMFKISSKTFYQINHEQTEKLYSKIKEYASLQGNEVVLDAYCGVGTIGMTLAKDCKKVIGVENNKQSVINARINASDNKIKNISFVLSDATEYIKEYNGEKIDTLIMDPPRSGSTEVFLKAIENLKPKKIVYVSCEAKTLARDLTFLKNYKIEKKCLVDMFVGTYHIETVVLLSLKEPRK